MSIKQITIEVNESYEPLYTAKTRYKDLWGGRGRGGSHAGTDYFLRLITSPVYFRGYFIRNVFTDIRMSLFQDFKDRVNGNPTLDPKDFVYNENRLTVRYLPTGNMIYSKGVSKDSDRTASMKSLAGATHVLIEEANELSEEHFDQLDMSLRTSLANEVEVIRVFNPPPKRHWIWRDYVLTEKKVFIKGLLHSFYTAEPERSRSLVSMFSTYHSNIENIQASTVEKFEVLKERNQEYYYNQVMGLIPDGLIGKVYQGWKQITVQKFEQIEAPSFYAVDWGFHDPTVLLELKIKGLDVYAREHIYMANLDNISFAKMLKGLGISKHDVIVGDPGGGGDFRMAELRRGISNVPGYPDLVFNVVSAVKGSGSILAGIDKVKGRNVFVTEDSTNLLAEYLEYSWDLGPDRLPMDRPKGGFDHALDALRYGVMTDERYEITKNLVAARGGL